MSILISKIIALIWLILGVLFIIFPNFAKRFLLFLCRKHIKKILILLIFLILVSVFQIFFKEWTLRAIISLVLLFIILFRYALLLKQKAVEHIKSWLTSINPFWYRLAGLVLTLCAYLIFKFSK